VAGGAAAYLALRPHEGWAKRAAREETPLEPWTLPSDPPADRIEMMRALIGAAVLAPSYLNSQPWRFAVDTDPARPAIRLIADVQRAVPATDPDRRWMMTSLGAALENLLVTARAYALRPSVKYFPDRQLGATASAEEVVAEITWTNGDGPRDRAFFEAIPQRRTNRRGFDGRGLFAENKAKLNAQVAEGIQLHWIDERKALNEMAEQMRDAVRTEVRDPAAQAEHYHWMRLGDEDARRRGDGVSTDALDLGGPARWFARRYFDPDSWFLRMGAESAGKQARSQVRSAGALALLTTKEGTDAEWLEAGQTYERIALVATQVGVSIHPMNAPIRQESYREQLARRFAAGGEHPLMLLRLGHASRPPETPRRAVALVASFRQS
jgi:nitroreductase